MIHLSTNALVLVLRATCHEQHRLRAILENDAEADEIREEAGDDMNILHEALSRLIEAYERRRKSEPSLPPLAHFVDPTGI